MSPRRALSSRVRPRGQVSDRPPREVGQPPAAQMLGLVVQDVTALARGREVRGVVVLRIVVTVGSREDDAGGARVLKEAVGRLQATDRLPRAVTPPMSLVIPPAAITEVQHHAPVRPAARLAPALGTPKPDRGRQLAPVDRVKPAVVPADRHGEGRSEPAEQRPDGMVDSAPSDFVTTAMVWPVAPDKMAASSSRGSGFASCGQGEREDSERHQGGMGEPRHR